MTATSKLKLLDLRFVNNSISESCYVDFIVDQMKFIDVNKGNNDNQQQDIDVSFFLIFILKGNIKNEPVSPLVWYVGPNVA